MSCSEPTDVEYSFEDDETASDAVVAAVAARTNSDPLEIDPLYEHVDPDALDALFEPRGTDTARPDDVRIEFQMSGFQVTVTADSVAVEDSRAKQRPTSPL